MVCSMQQNLSQRLKILVFTDLDGTFLDHNSYDYTLALPALDKLKDIDATVLSVTSKTASEIHALSLPLDTKTYIAENGMVMCHDNIKTYLNKSYEEIRSFLDNLSPDLRLHIVGFGDMSVEEIMTHTDLGYDNAVLAKTREATEPFLWNGSKDGLDELVRLAQLKGFNITQGGRFYHLMGAGDKGDAVEKMTRLYKDKYKDKNVVTIALGDGPNDAKMLSCVNYGVKIPNHNGHDFDIENPQGKIIYPQQLGPAGWTEGMEKILDELSL